MNLLVSCVEAVRQRGKLIRLCLNCDRDLNALIRWLALASAVHCDSLGTNHRVLAQFKWRLNETEHGNEANFVGESVFSGTITKVFHFDKVAIAVLEEDSERFNLLVVCKGRRPCHLNVQVFNRQYWRRHLYCYLSSENICRLGEYS